MRQQSNPFNLILVTLIGILISCLTYLYVFEAYAFSSSFYIKHFEALEVQNIVGISTQDLEKVTTELINYIDTGKGDLHVTATINSQTIEYFNPKEQAHLNDIKNLVKEARKIRSYLLSLTAALLILILLINYSSLYKVTSILLTSALSSFLTLFLLGILYLLDFDMAFRKFHELLFYNDLWLLNPAKDRLLQMMPLEFFMIFTLYCLGTVFLIQGFFILVYKLLRKHRPDKKRMFR